MPFRSPSRSGLRVTHELPEQLLTLYRPIEPLGQGGMGRVVRAHERSTGKSVAIKLIAREHLADAHTRRIFLREARTIVRLSHPHVVQLFDFDMPREGSAYLVMEYLAQGHLGVWRDVWPGWVPLLEAVDGVLSALAFAHARGIVHCDLKPENILFESDSLGGRAKLVDFGVAQLAAASLEHQGHARDWRRPEVSGTPTYMAPEQVEGHLGAYGPWTDLYALGVILYEVISGAPPFAAQSLPAILLQHLNEVPPPLSFRPQAPSLEGIASIVDSLLAKDPWARPRFAARLRRSIARLMPEAARADNAALDPSLPETSASVRRRTLNSFARLPQAATLEVEASSWVRSTGLRMLRLKEPPFVGREEALERLEVTVDAVVATQRPHLVVVTGPAGVGKSRIARALQERLEESGRMQSWSGAYRMQTGEPAQGLRAALEAYYLCLGLSRELTEHTLRERIGQSGDPLDHWELRNLLDWLRPTEGARLAPSEASQVNLVLRAMRRAARRDPLYIWLDDLHHTFGDAILSTLITLLEEEGLPALIVVTMRPIEDTIDPTGRLRKQLRALYGHDRVQRIKLGSLEIRVLAELLETQAGLGPKHARRIATDARGNPLRALQTARAAIELGELDLVTTTSSEATGTLTLNQNENEFAERSRPTLVSPLASGRLLAGHLDEVLSRMPQPQGFLVMGQLALLGPMTPLPVLDTALRYGWPDLDWSTLATILDEADRIGVLEWQALGEHDRISLDHRPLVRFLTETLERRGLLERAHRAAAQALATVFTHDPANTLAARARHHAQAGDRDDAAKLLHDAITHAAAQAHFSHAIAASGELEGWLHDWGEPDISPKRAALHRLRARIAFECGELHDAEHHLGEELAFPTQDPSILAERAWLRARLHAGRGEIDEAVHTFEIASRGYLSAKDDPGLAQCLLGLARTRRVQGNLDHARRVAERARALFDTLEQPSGLADVHRLLGQIALLEGHLEDAGQHYEQARSIFDALGDLHGHADTQRALAGLALERQDARQATRLLHAATQAYELIGDRQGIAHAQRGLGRACRLLGQHTAAREHLERAVQLLEPLGDALGTADALMDLASMERERGQLAEAGQHISRAIQAYHEAGEPRGSANALLIQGNLLLDLGQPHDALTRYRQAQNLFVSLEDERGRGLALLNTGHALLQLGALEPARDALDEAERDALTRGDQPTAAVAAGYLSIALVPRDLDEAIEAARRARQRSTPAVAMELAHAFERLAREMASLGHPEPAKEHLEQVRSLLLDAGRRDLLRQTFHRNRDLLS